MNESKWEVILSHYVLMSAGPIQVFGAEVERMGMQLGLHNRRIQDTSEIWRWEKGGREGQFDKFVRGRNVQS